MTMKTLNYILNKTTFAPVKLLAACYLLAFPLCLATFAVYRHLCGLLALEVCYLFAAISLLSILSAGHIIYWNFIATTEQGGNARY